MVLFFLKFNNYLFFWGGIFESARGRNCADKKRGARRRVERNERRALIFSLVLHTASTTLCANIYIESLCAGTHANFTKTQSHSQNSLFFV